MSRKSKKILRFLKRHRDSFFTIDIISKKTRIQKPHVIGILVGLEAHGLVEVIRTIEGKHIRYKKG